MCSLNMTFFFNSTMFLNSNIVYTHRFVLLVFLNMVCNIPSYKILIFYLSTPLLMGI